MARYPAASEPPAGLVYVPDFVTASEERALLDEIANLDFASVRMHDVVAKRRVIHYGWDYKYEAWAINRTTPVASFLQPLRARVAAFAALDENALEEVLLSEYTPGAGIGWHRDAPMFGPNVYGVSLGSACTMRFRRKRGRGFEAWSLELAARSLYVLGGAARTIWQHTIPPAKSLRYSVTFRTVKRK